MSRLLGPNGKPLDPEPDVLRRLIPMMYEAQHRQAEEYLLEMRLMNLRASVPSDTLKRIPIVWDKETP